MNIPVIFEDDWLLIVDKPAGLLTIPTAKHESRTLTSILNDDACQKGAAYRLHPCHRLDRDTSGLIVYAKGKSTQQKVMQLFKERKVRKTYTAFVQGHPKESSGEISVPVAGMSSLTRYRVVERRKDYSVVEVAPVTGRTNQIRIHFAGIGHPIVGEEKFAFRRDFTLRAKRLCLHAAKLCFAHPITGGDLSLAAPLPEELEKFLSLH